MSPLEGFFNDVIPWKTVDHRVDGWLFMSSIWPVSVTVILAISVVLFGPIYMRSRRPLNIVPIMMISNLFIVILNLHVLFQLWLGSYRKQYSWICEANNSSATDTEEKRIVAAIHLLFISKMIEMLDIVFLVAMKKSMARYGGLIFHHMASVCFSWAGTRWIPGGSSFVVGIINTTSHIIIYGYLSLAFIAPRATKSPLIKTAFSCFIVMLLLVYVIYGLIVIWVQCPSTLPFAKCGVIAMLGIVMLDTILNKFDYQRSGAKGGIIGDYINKLIRHSDKVLTYD